MSFLIRPMLASDVLGAIALQAACFPPPFSDDLHWDPEHLLKHIELFPEGQFVADLGGQVIASCSNTLITEERWQAHGGWGATVGGPYLRNFDRQGSTLYGLDIAVDPLHRRQGIAKQLYRERFGVAKRLNLVRYGTACRMPGWAAWSAKYGGAGQGEYAVAVRDGFVEDITLTPLLSMGLTFLEVIHNYMPDPESGDAGALLERIL